MSRKTDITREINNFSEKHKQDIIAELPDTNDPPSWEERVERLYKDFIIPRLERLEKRRKLTAIERSVLEKGRTFLLYR